MANISTFLFLTTLVQLCDKAFSDYLTAYSEEDIIKRFPPLRFPGPESTKDISSLKQELSVVEEQIQKMKLAQKVGAHGAAAAGAIPVVGGAIQSATNLLADHLLSAADLQDLSQDLKIKLGFQKELSKYSLSHFKADAKVLQRRLRELSGNSSTDTKSRSAIPAIQVCEKILQLFKDETFLFWELKLIFYPHLMSFTGLYATVASAAALLIPDKLDTLKEDMELLQATIIKYHPGVKKARLSMLHLGHRSYFQENGHAFSIIRYCAKLRILKHKPSSPLTSCIRGDNGTSESKGESLLIDELDESQAEVEWPEWFEDTLTGEVTCGWEACWNSLHEFYGNEIDNLTMAALELIPFTTPPSQLSPAPKREYTECGNLDGYGRLRKQEDVVILPYKSVLDLFDCRDGYCTKSCEIGWCSTRNPKRAQHVRCKRQEDCCPEWDCHEATFLQCIGEKGTKWG